MTRERFDARAEVARYEAALRELLAALDVEHGPRYCLNWYERSCLERGKPPCAVCRARKALESPRADGADTRARLRARRDAAEAALRARSEALATGADEARTKLAALAPVGDGKGRP